MITPDSLRKFRLFQDVASADLLTISVHMERQTYRPSQLIFRDGELADAIYLVDFGTVELIKIGVGLTVLATVGTGGRFGDVAFFNGGRRAASARARELTQLLRLPYSCIRQLLQTRPGFAVAFYRNSSSSLSRRLQRALADLSVARELAA